MQLSTSERLLQVQSAQNIAHAFIETWLQEVPMKAAEGRFESHQDGSSHLWHLIDKLNIGTRLGRCFRDKHLLRTFGGTRSIFSGIPSEKLDPPLGIDGRN